MQTRFPGAVAPAALLLAAMAVLVSACGPFTVSTEAESPVAIEVGEADGDMAAVNSSASDTAAGDATASAAADTASLGNLVWSSDSGTRLWATSITVFDGDNEYQLPLDTQSASGSGKEIKLDWPLDDGTRVELYFYLRHNEENWWAYQIRTMVSSEDEDGDWIYYPGDFFSGTDAGRYMISPLGVSYQGSLDLATVRIEGLRVEAWGAEFPVDPSADLGERPARGEWTKPTRTHRMEASHALLDADAVNYVIMGERRPAGVVANVEQDGVLVERGDRQELEVRWTDPETADISNPDSLMMLYFRTDGTDWWVYRLWVSINGERVINAEGLELWRTPLGEVYEGDLTAGGLEITGARLELLGCVGPREGLRGYEECDLEQ